MLQPNTAGTACTHKAHNRMHNVTVYNVLKTQLHGSNAPNTNEP